MKSKSGFTIERFFGGKRYVVELTNEELEKAFRYRDKEYMKEDAARQLFDFFGLDINDYSDKELNDVQLMIDERNGGFDLKALANDNDVLECLIDDFSENQDCNMAENDTWQNVIRDFLREEFNYKY